MYQPYNYAKRLERIEELKAKERRLSTLKQNTDTQTFVERSIGETNDIVANKLSIGSGEQYRKEKFIVDNKQSLPLLILKNGMRVNYQQIKHISNNSLLIIGKI